MVEVVFELIAKEERGGQLELVFGAGGAWSKLVARSPGFHGTTLLRDTRNPRRFLVFDLWDTEAQREQMMAAHGAELAELDAVLAELLESRTEVGTFSMRSQGTVRPVGRGRAPRGRS